LKVSFVKIVFSFWTDYETLPLACFWIYYVSLRSCMLALLKVALVNFTLNEYMMMMMMMHRCCTFPFALAVRFLFIH